MTSGPTRCVVVAAIGALAMTALSGASLAARETTNPGLAPVSIYVTETDKGITYTMWQNVIDDGQPAQLAAPALERGEVATFKVTNKGKRPHTFSAFGKTTRRLVSGAKAQFKVALIRRGTFTYQSTLDKGKRGFRGVMKVE